MVEHRIGKFGLITLGKEGAGDVDELGDHHLGRGVAGDQFGPAGPKQRPQRRVDPGDRPFRHQRTIGHLVDLCLPGHRRFHQEPEQRHITFFHVALVEMFAKAKFLELVHHLVDGLARGLHLKQRLHRVEPRRAAHLALLVA